jgi:hypothetical protein
MKTYQFTVILSGTHQVTEEAANRLYEAGCSDGTFCARDRTAYIHFDRVAKDLKEAVRSAIDNVRAAGFEVMRVESDEYTILHGFNKELAHTQS